MKYSERLATLTPAQINEARIWLGECEWRDCDADYIMEEATDMEVVKAVARHFDGGWAGFLLATVVCEPTVAGGAL
jgi:hypothetical protein